MVSSWRRTSGLIAVAGVIAFIGVVMSGTPAYARDYAANRTGAMEFADDFCSGKVSGGMAQGLADYVWLSAPSSENDTTVSVTYPSTVVKVRVNLYARHCSQYPSGFGSGSTYGSDVGGIAGAFTYGNNYANGEWSDYQEVMMNVKDWAAGAHTICMSLTTWTDVIGYSPKTTPSACSVITLNVVYPWTTDGRSQVGVNHTPNVSRWDAFPGDTVTWNHRLWNNSAYNMNRTIYWSVRQSGFTHPDDVWRNSSTNPDGWSSGPPNGSFDNPFVNIQPYKWDTLHIVRDEDVGQTLCQQLVWTPKQWNTAIDTPEGLGQSSNACVYVPYTFELKPSVAAITPAAESGVTIGPITPTVSNGGRTWSYKDTQWRVSRFVVAPGKSVPTGTDNQQLPCDYYANGCKDDIGRQQFVRGDTVVGQIPTYNVQDLPLGSQVCFALSVTGFNQDHQPTDGWWRHSQPQCVKIGKKPKVQIWGDDAAVRGKINTSTTMKGGKMFGSWVEYAALSSSTNSNFASAAGLVDQANAGQADWSKLTFANVDADGNAQFGSYAPLASFRSLPGVAAYFSALQGSQSFTGGSLDANSFPTGGPVVVRTAGGITLDTQTLHKGNSVVIVADGTVTIKGDLTYEGGGLTGVQQLPQLVIIAKNINIQQSVSTVDAWLVTSDTANGVVNTCSDGGDKLSGNICNKQLTVHGPVIAGKLLLRRTAGSGTGDQSGDPAEVFNTRPDAYLWAQLVASGSGKVQTVNVVELPPRF